MSKFLYIPLIRDNAIEVENLRSYVRRLASAHCVTPHQLLSLMEPPTEHLNGRKRRLLTRIAYERGMSLCNCCDDTLMFVERIEACTGAHELRSATFLPLASTISKRPAGITKNHRAWCPACYNEALQRGGVVYDRVYWISAYCKRCIVHKIRLVDQCPSCTAIQRRFHRSGDLTVCYVCGKSLIGRPTSWIRENAPTYGEREILELIEHFVLNPGQPFASCVLQRFWERLRLLQPGRFLPRRIYGSANPTFYSPLLSVLVGTAIAHEISMVLLLTAPELAASAASRSLIAAVTPVHKTRKIRTATLHSKLRERLDASIAMAFRHELPPSLKSICDGVGVSTGYARYHFDELCCVLSGYRKLNLWSNKEKAYKAIHTALRGGLYDKYRKGLIHSQDELADRLVEELGVPENYARYQIQTYARSTSMVAANGG